MSETRILSEFVADLRFKDLPGPVVEQACRITADTIGCAINAWTEDPEKARVAARIARIYAMKSGASVIGAAGFEAQPAFAALANGILANAADNDDTHKRALLHTGSVVVPTALALTETEALSGQSFIVSLVAGYEVAVRVAMAVMPTHYRFWHSTGTNGTFGAAAAAAKSFKLNGDGVQRALGLAGTQAAGLNAFFESGDMTKSIHPGKAALNGILSAQLAKIGATSPPSILEHPKGYLHAFSTEPKPEALVRGLGTTWEILQNGFKYFPSILASHSPIQATLATVRKHAIDPRRIARVTNETYNTVKTHFSNKDINTVMAARVSVPYCIAVAAVDGELTQKQFSAKRIADPLVREVLSKTEIIADAELNRFYPDKFPSRVTVVLDDGRSFQETVLFPKGDPQDPFTVAEINSKFRGNVAGILTSRQADKLLKAIYALPNASDISNITTLLQLASQEVREAAHV
jgi:2-methylcitrate dehydratase PrpD